MKKHRPISIEGNRIEITTARLSAVLEGAELVELRNARGTVLAQRASGKRPAPVELRFANGEKVDVGANAPARVVSLGERMAHVHVADENGDVTLRLLIDDQDRLVIEPSAQTLRRGLCGVGWRIPGIAKRLQLVAPFFQGCRQDLTHPLVAGKYWEWPCSWEAGFVVLQGKRDGFSVAAYDRLNVPKAVEIGGKERAGSLTFHTLAHGPAADSVAVGSLRWVIDAHDGDWTVPAGVYREWLHRDIGADRLKALRPDWVDDIRLALQWSGNAPEVLDAVARIMDPHRVLIHHATWRSDPYDVNYPEYRASREGAAFLAKGRAMGYRIMPHFNYFSIDPEHPEFARMTDFVVRDFSTRRLRAWRWNGQWVQPPQAYGRLKGLRDEKLMYHLHPGASPWRRLLAERIAAAATRHRLSAVFVDQTLCAWNADNALVENLSMAEGVVALTRELTELDGLPAVGGEGLNEMIMRYQSFAQAHLFDSYHHNCPHFDELDPVPVGRLLYGDLCRTMGYSGLGGDTQASVRRLEVHERLGALPSLEVRKPDDVLNPNPAVRRVLDRANA
jgi:hypothetical protein